MHVLTCLSDLQGEVMPAPAPMRAQSTSGPMHEAEDAEAPASGGKRSERLKSKGAAEGPAGERSHMPMRGAEGPAMGEELEGMYGGYGGDKSDDAAIHGSRGGDDKGGSSEKPAMASMRGPAVETPAPSRPGADSHLWGSS